MFQKENEMMPVCEEENTEEDNEKNKIEFSIIL